jgi:hypothetical protein
VWKGEREREREGMREWEGEGQIICIVDKIKKEYYFA